MRKASLYARSLLEASLDPLVTISREGKITDVNQATEKVTGISREKLIGSDFSNYFTDPEGARRGYEQVFARGAVQDYPRPYVARRAGSRMCCTTPPCSRTNWARWRVYSPLRAT